MRMVKVEKPWLGLTACVNFSLGILSNNSNHGNTPRQFKSTDSTRKTLLKDELNI